MDFAHHLMTRLGCCSTTLLHLAHSLFLLRSWPPLPQELLAAPAAARHLGNCTALLMPLQRLLLLQRQRQPSAACAAAEKIAS